MTKFVLMLTRDDVTVPDAHAILELALSAGTEHIGFKDHAHLEVRTSTQRWSRRRMPRA